jgi:alpha-ketoglutaric semialdehyde dehydrogenase
MTATEWLYATADEPTVLTNPAQPDAVVAEHPRSAVSDVASAVTHAASKFSLWRESGPMQRAEVLHGAGDILLRDEQSIATTISRETGKHIRDSVAEVRNAAGVLHYYAGRAWNPVGNVLPSTRAGVAVSTRREPLGVVAMITPWNFPVNLLAVKLAPALAAGNAVVAKPSTIGAGASLQLVAALYEAGLPDGVVNVVLGDGAEVGEALVRADGISAMSFTGSTAVGRSIAAKSAKLGRRCLCEMGGKNASVVLDDADLDLTVTTLLNASFSATGQKCTATSRIIVQRGIAEKFTEAFLAAMEGVRFGAPFDDDAYSGPVVNRAQFGSIVDEVEGAAARGEKQVTAWQIPANPERQGYFVPPTVFNRVSPRSRLFQHEIFGPVVAVTETEDAASALRLLNDSAYGLSASVFTHSLDSARLFEDGARCGVVNVNLPTTGVEFQSPLAGWKESGTSYLEQGDEGLQFYTASKTVASRVRRHT